MKPCDIKVIRQKALDFIAFLNASPSPYHATENCCRMLKAAGYTELRESESWNDLKPMGKYYMHRNCSTVIAFAIGGKWKPGNGFSVVAAHTDSPCFKLKPRSKRSSGGCLQLGVMTYGGGIWRSWFDRDLSVAGRVIVKTGPAGSIEHRLCNLERPIICIPSLAIHLDRESNDAFKLNRETHLRPVLATELIEKQLNGKTAAEDVTKKSDAKAGDECANEGENDHHSCFLQLVADTICCKPSDILDMELCVYDTQRACLTGIHEEFIAGARLDNLVGTYTAVHGILNSTGLEQDPNVRMVACYDNEECGSESAQGAASSVTEWVMRRIVATGCATNGESTLSVRFEESMPKSLLISADQAHALHPNYKDKYEDENAAKFHCGVVVKINANQRYATTSITHSVLKEIADCSNVPLQPFVVRNDSPCGSTIGPIMSTKLAMPTIDVGTPQLAMHSVREMACTSGITHAMELYKGFFENYPSVYARLTI